MVCEDHPRRWFNWTFKAEGKWQRTEGRTCWTGNRSVLGKEIWDRGQSWCCLKCPSLEQGSGWGWDRGAYESLIRYKGRSTQILIQVVTKSEMHRYLYQTPLTLYWNGLFLCLCPPPLSFSSSRNEFYYRQCPMQCLEFIYWMNEWTNSATQLYSPILASFSFLCCFWF